MKILHVYRTYYPDSTGGIEEGIRQIALTTQCHGIESRVLTLSPTANPVVLNRTEGLVWRSRYWAAPAGCRLGGWSFFRQWQVQIAWADVIHYHYPWPFADMMHWCLGRQKVAVMTYHADVVRQFRWDRVYAPLRRWMLAKMRYVIATSPQYAASSAVLSHQVHAEQLKIIPMGIDEHSVQVEQQQAKLIDIQQRFGLLPGRYFLFIGVLRYYKGLHHWLAADSISLPIVIAGDGPEMNRLKQLSSHHVNHAVHFLGQVSDAEKYALLANCLAFVFPSHLRAEAFGLSLVEASMMAKPMISCQIQAGMSHINIDQVTGLVVPPADPAALASACQQLAQNPTWANQMGQAARQRYQQLFAGPVLGQSYADLYRACVP